MSNEWNCSVILLCSMQCDSSENCGTTAATLSANCYREGTCLLLLLLDELVSSSSGDLLVDCACDLIRMVEKIQLKQLLLG